MSDCVAISTFRGLKINSQTVSGSIFSTDSWTFVPAHYDKALSHTWLVVHSNSCWGSWVLQYLEVFTTPKWKTNSWRLGNKAEIFIAFCYSADKLSRRLPYFSVEEHSSYQQKKSFKFMWKFSSVRSCCFARSAILLFYLFFFMSYLVLQIEVHTHTIYKQPPLR